ncbi:MAG: transglycosylase domain-containing protein [Erysipelotrichales bacterium]
MKKNQKKSQRSMPITVVDWLLKFVFVGMIGVAILFVVSFFQLPKLDVESMIRPNDSFVYDKNDKVVGTISRKKENQTNITYNDLNQNLINILVGTEDSSFFNHHGVDFVNTVESAFTSLSGSSKSGGSTITQQIVGWTHLDRNKKTVTRKAQEILLSLRIERSVSKEEIMEMYYNYFFYGRNNIHGVEKASEYFFDKKAGEMDTVQTALMVGTLNAPTAYNPLGRFDERTGEHFNYSKNRLDNVLLASKNQGYIGDNEYYLLQQVKVEDSVKINDTSKANKYNAYIDLVRREMEDKYKVNLSTTSTKIYTNMDIKAQKYADKISSGKAPGLELPDKDMNFGMILTNTQDGSIAAVGGGKQYRRGGKMLLNNAVDIKQQPGSAIKPIIDYSPAYEYLHWGNRHVISNAPYKYPGTNTPIRNTDGQSGGMMTIDAALANSRNLTAVRAMEAVVNKVGFKGLNEYLTSLGLDFKDSELTYAYGLGGTETGLSPSQMNGAYQAFGNGGKYIEPWTIRYYTDPDGKKIENPTKPKQAIDERTAFMMATALELSTQKSVLLGATNFSGTPHAAKTGTSNWGKEGAQYGIPNLSPKDSWVSGFTSKYTLSVWSGFDAKGIKKGRYPNWGREHDYAAILWGAMMRKVTTGNEKSYLNQKPPKGIVGSGYGGYYYSENGQFQEFNPDNYSVDVLLDGGNLVVNFDQITDVNGVNSRVKIGDQIFDGSGTYPIKEKQKFTVYYSYNGERHKKKSGCIENKKIVKKCSK